MTFTKKNFTALIDGITAQGACMILNSVGPRDTLEGASEHGMTEEDVLLACAVLKKLVKRTPASELKVLAGPKAQFWYEYGYK